MEEDDRKDFIGGYQAESILILNKLRNKKTPKK
jgi:hypothetical protein